VSKPLVAQMTEKVSKPPSSLPSIDPGRSNLLEEIRRGGSLRHVSPEKKVVVADSRCELMDQIRQGKALKKVENIISEQEPAQQATPGIAGMLQRALQERGVAMGMSSSEGEDSDGADDDDEWDD